LRDSLHFLDGADLALALLHFVGMVYLLLLLLMAPFESFAAPTAAPVTVNDPSVQAVQQEAIRYLSYDQHQLDSWDKKTKLAAALPRVQVGFQRDLKDTVSLTTRDNVSVSDGEVFVGPNESNFDQNFNQGTVIGVKALWYLDELVFNRDMLAASAERREWVRERNRVLQQVTEAYFTRRRLIQELKKRTDPLPIREKKKILLDRSTAVLDAGTGGWFSQQIRQGGLP
jgi:hypothetical protein